MVKFLKVFMLFLPCRKRTPLTLTSMDLSGACFSVLLQMLIYYTNVVLEKTLKYFRYGHPVSNIIRILQGGGGFTIEPASAHVS